MSALSSSPSRPSKPFSWAASRRNSATTASWRPAVTEDVDAAVGAEDHDGAVGQDQAFEEVASPANDGHGAGRRGFGLQAVFGGNVGDGFGEQLTQVRAWVAIQHLGESVA